MIQRAASLPHPAVVCGFGSGEIQYVNEAANRLGTENEGFGEWEKWLTKGDGRDFIRGLARLGMDHRIVVFSFSGAPVKWEVSGYYDGMDGVLLTLRRCERGGAEFTDELSVYRLDRQGTVVGADETDWVLAPGKQQDFFEFFDDSDRSAVRLAFERAGTEGLEEYVAAMWKIDDDRREEVYVRFLQAVDSREVFAVVQHLADFIEVRPLNKRREDRADLLEQSIQILQMEIAEHRLTKRRLQHSETFVRNLLDSSLNMILSLDEELKITEVNRTAQRILEYDRGELLGRSIYTVFESNGRLKAGFQEVDSSGSFMGEYTCRKASGQALAVFASLSVLRDSQGQKVGYLCALRDLSEVNRWRRKLKLTEERYGDLFENATDMVCGFDMEGRILYANRSWYDKMGYSETETSKLRIHDLIQPKFRENFNAYFASLKETEGATKRIWNLRNKFGDPIIVETNDNVKREEGRPLLVRSIMRDVTDKVKTERNMKDQSAKIKAIFESGSVMLWTVNRNIALTSFNAKYAEAIESHYGVKPEINRDPSKPKMRFASKAYHDFWNQKYAEVFETGKSVNFQTKTTDLQGKVHYRDIHLNPIKFDADGDVKEVAGMGIDITEKKEAERTLSEQSRKIQTIFNSTNHMIWSVGTDYKLTFFNEAFAEKMYSRFGIRIQMGDNILEVSERNKNMYADKWKILMHRAFDGQKIQFEEDITDIHGNRHREEISLSPIVNDRGQVSEITGLSQTITFKKAAETKLREQAAKIHAIFDSTAMLIWTLDRNFRILAYNKVFGDKHRQFLGHEVSIGSNFLNMIEDRLSEEGFRNLKEFLQHTFRGKKQQFEGRLEGLDGRTRWMETYFGPVYSQDGTIKEISCISHEITDKKIIEQKMKENIREKEILLQEVHHRVKNNLQVISSILNLQTSFVKDKESLDILRESQNRIKSMSFIHESLYQTKDFSGIEFSDYILSLSQNLIHTYSLNKTDIELVTDLHHTKISLDQAIPCGLIVNEIVTNALKYAFPNRDKGTISLSISDERGVVRLGIGDDGIGMPEGIDPEDADTLGIQLIYTLIEQLDATIELNTQGGTNYLITFEKQP